MIRRFLLVSLLSLCILRICGAQDPSVGAISVNPPTLTLGGAFGSITLTIGNSSSAAIPQANNATYTISVPPNIEVLSVGIEPHAPNIFTTIGTYDPILGTIVPYDPLNSINVTLVSNEGPVPANASNVVTILVRAKQLTNGNPAVITVNASSNPALTTNVSGNDMASTTVNVEGPLPVELISFIGQAQADHTIELIWTTSLETNNSGFVVERSKDLKRFERVGEIKKDLSMSHALTNYRLIDPMPYTGTSYYRLTQTDLNGRRNVYPAISVVLRDSPYGVSPNPVINDGQFYLQLDEPETAIIGFYASNGRIIPLQKKGVQSGCLLLKTTNKPSKGVYVLTVEERGQRREHRLIVE